MKFTLHRPVAILSVLAVGILIIIQIYWFMQTRSLEEKEFDSRVNLTLRSVADKLVENSDQIDPVSKTSSNTFYVRVGSFFAYPTIDSLLRNELANHQISTPFELLIYNEADTLLLGNYYSTGPMDARKAVCVDRDQEHAKMNFSVRFPDKDAAILASIDLWVFSAGIFVVILVVLGIFVLDTMRQKKLAVMKNDFISNMTHELQTPISNISMASEVLRTNEALPADKQKKYLEIIHEENLRLKGQVEQVLQTASLEKGEMGMRFEEIDLGRLIGNVIERFRFRVEKRNGTIAFNPEQGPLPVAGDSTHLYNLFYNLLDNADKYSPGSPSINVTAGHRTGLIEVRVEDKGIGMDKTIQRSVFEKFYRATEENIHDVKGFGLGLAYVKKIVEAHQGTISVQSKPHAGSCFTVTLPVCR